MPRYKLIIEYDGTNFIGWQKQKLGKSIQQSLEEAIYPWSKEKVTVFGAGRTDAGVHALAQVAHFDLTKSWDTFKIREAINAYLIPRKIAVLKVIAVNDKFHARFSATKRHYLYKIIHRRAHLTLEKEHCWHIKKNLDIRPMQLSANQLIGQHDFTSFRSIHCQAKSPIKTIDNIEITLDNNYINFKVTAPSFLHHQVRFIVGTIIRVGLKKISHKDIKEILISKNQQLAGPLAPAHGLYLAKIEYPLKDSNL